MANMAARVTAAYFDSKGLKYELLGDEQDVLRAGFTMDNREGLRVFVFFDDDAKSCKVRASDVVKFPADKKAAIYEVCSKMNAQYRWVKFFVDESDNTVTVDDDAILDLDTCGEEVFRCCLQLIHIVDAAYPEIMKAIWA